MKRALLLLALALPACGSAATGVGVLSAVDAIGRGVAHVAGWCDERGIEPETVRTVYKAIDERDWRLALTEATRLVSAARARGDQVPEDVEVTLRLAEGAVAAQAIQDGMRAVSQ